MILKEKVTEAIELSQKIPIYNAFDESTMNHFNIVLREIKRFSFASDTPTRIKAEIDRLLIIHPEKIDEQIGYVNPFERIVINKFGGPMYSFNTIFSKKDIQKRKYVLKNYFKLEKILRMLK